MVKRFLLLVLILVVSFSYTLGQDSTEMLKIDPDLLDGVSIVNERTFTKESLFGYMNGGAELYLEYGFEKLVVTDLVVDNLDLKAEIYRMPDIDRAFGIYSVNIFRCNDSNALTQYYCESDYQVQFCKGDYYVNIINNSGSPQGLLKARRVATQISSFIPNDSFSSNDYIPEAFMPENVDKLFLISGQVAMANNAFKYSHYLEGYSDYNVLIVETGKKSMLIIRFNKGDQIERFLNSMGLDQFPVCGVKVALNEIELSLTDKGDIILHIDGK